MAKSGAAQREGKVLSQKSNKQKSFTRSCLERAQGNGADTEDKNTYLLRWFMITIPEFGRLRQMNYCEMEASLGY